MDGIEKPQDAIFLDYLDGLLLGDGCITKSKTSIKYMYSQSCITSCKEWLEFIQEKFEFDGIESKISLHRKPGRYFNKSLGGIITSNGSHHLWSHVYDFFTEQDKRWYIKDYDVDRYNVRRWHEDEGGEWYARRKIVPKDIKLTPECVANWYMGDGSPPSRSGQIKLFTNSFTKEEVEFLSFLLEDQVVKETHVYQTKSKNYVIHINTRSSVHSFFDYVRPYVEQVSCFHYKIPEMR